MAGDNPTERRRLAHTLARWSSIILLLPSTMAVGFFVGHWLDGRLGTSPWLGMIGFFLGSAGGLYQTYKIVSGRD